MAGQQRPVAAAVTEYLSETPRAATRSPQRLQVALTPAEQVVLVGALARDLRRQDTDHATIRDLLARLAPCPGR
jgi:hypothetical protein